MGCREVGKEAKITPACPKLLEIGLDWPKTNLLPTDICPQSAQDTKSVRRA